MKKLLVTTLSALFVAGLLSVPTGCGSNEATKIDPSEIENEPTPPGHEQALEEMNKKPSN